MGLLIIFKNLQLEYILYYIIHWVNIYTTFPLASIINKLKTFFLSTNVLLNKTTILSLRQKKF